MQKYLSRSPEELHTQANVSAPLPSKPVEVQPYVRTLKRVEYPSNTTPSPTSEQPNKIHREENANENHALQNPIKQENAKSQPRQERNKSPVKEAKQANEHVKKMEIDEPIPEAKQKTVEEEEFLFVSFIVKCFHFNNMLF